MFLVNDTAIMAHAYTKQNIKLFTTVRLKSQYDDKFTRPLFDWRYLPILPNKKQSQQPKKSCENYYAPKFEKVVDSLREPQISNRPIK